ncbi:hydratase [Caballeronia udeis]|uniref:Hydratase n=1 Tax=Caballeronia udeis TaxID=1232866 RepID=A0A163VTN1_9BURK|nr:hydratase [Caballeronia udeis]
MSVRTVSAKVVANLGWDKVKATHVVFAGDTLYAESTVLAKRKSASRPTQGIVTVETREINKDDKIVMMFERTMLIYKRGHSPEEAADYFSKRVASLARPVTTPRPDTRLVVTEYGVASLKGLSSTQRATGLIRLAHPTFATR